MGTATIKITSRSTAVLTYSISNTATTTRISFTSCKFTNSRDTGTTEKLSLDIYGIYGSGAHFSTYYEPSNTAVSIPKGTKSKTIAINRWYEYAKTHSAQSANLNINADIDTADDFWGGDKDVPVSIPAKTSYAVTYNANGGSGAPSGQTKWHGEPLKLSTATPTRVGYVFSHWNTKANGSGTSYQKGANYTGNTALPLYAIWYAYPTISSIKAYRCDENGVQDDLGEHCYIEATWRVDTSKSGNTGTVTGAYSPWGGAVESFALSGSASGSGGTAWAILDGIDGDTQYAVAVTVADTIGSTSRATIVTTTHFDMDFKRGGGAIGIGSAAPSDGFAVGWDADFRADFMRHGRSALPVYLYSSQPAAADVPVLPCLVVLTSGAHYLYTSGGIKTL